MLRKKIKRKPKPKVPENSAKIETPVIDPEVAEVQKAKRQRLDSASSSKGIYKTSRSRKTSENKTISEEIAEKTQRLTKSISNEKSTIATTIPAQSISNQNSTIARKSQSIPAVIQQASPLPPVQEILTPSPEYSPTSISFNKKPSFRVPESPDKFTNLPLTEVSNTEIQPSQQSTIILRQPVALRSYSYPQTNVINHENFDTQSIASGFSQASTTSTTYRRYRAQEVKSKLKTMKKDESGQVIIDKDEFPLADLIYVSRHVGTKKTGLQMKREELEAKKRQYRENEERIKKEALEKSGEEEEDDGKQDNCKKEADVVVSELTEMQQSMKNKERMDKFKSMAKINEKGELVIDQTRTTETHPDKKQDFERDLGFDEVDSMNNYKRCYQKRCTGKARRWREKENLLFWEALAIVGQDFQLMECYFQSKQVRRNKAELKSKFSREDKTQRNLVNDCLKKASLRPLAMTDFITEITTNDSNNNLEMAT